MAVPAGSPKGGRRPVSRLRGASGHGPPLALRPVRKLNVVLTPAPSLPDQRKDVLKISASRATHLKGEID